MHINVCKHCKKVFIYKFQAYTCEDCKKFDDEQFEKIRDYLMKFPNSNALQIAAALDLDAFEIINYMNEGRLEISKGKFEKL